MVRSPANRGYLSDSVANAPKMLALRLPCTQDYEGIAAGSGHRDQATALWGWLPSFGRVASAFS